MLCIDLDISIPLVFLNDHELRILYYLIRSSPLQIFEDHAPVREVSCVLVELGPITRKLFVCPFLSRIGCEPLEDSIFLFVVFFHGVVGIIFLLEAGGATFLMRGIFDLKFGVGGGDVTLSVVHEVFFVVVISVEDVFAFDIGLRLRLFFLGIVFHKVSNYIVKDLKDHLALLWKQSKLQASACSVSAG